MKNSDTDKAMIAGCPAKVLAIIAIPSLMLGLAACHKASLEYTVPDTTMQISFPPGWLKMKQTDFEKAMEQMKKSKDIPSDYKDAVDAIKQFNRYTFLRPRVAGNKRHNLNLTVLTMKMDEVDFAQIAREQMQQMRGMTGYQSASMDDCPKPKLSHYRCFSTRLKLMNDERYEYHYITRDSGYFIEIGFGVSSPDELSELSGIAASIRVAGRPGPQTRQQ